MYHVINAHVDQILKQIPSGHVSEYDYLHMNRHDLDDRNYQRRFKVFWRLNAALLSETFCDHYFATLKTVLAGNWGIEDITKALYLVESHQGRHSLQFSFASKLLHTADARAPIYDSLVADFFFYAEPSRGKSIPQRIENLATFHRFLAGEYRRIIDNGLLATSVTRFRDRLKPKHFTDEKIIDSLIWGFVALQRGGAAGRREVVYC